jgi:hypothetical protein
VKGPAPDQSRGWQAWWQVVAGEALLLVLLKLLLLGV